MGNSGAWTKRDNTGSASPFVVDLTVAEAGERVVQYRATDKSGNVGAIKTLTFTVENRDVTTVIASDAGGLPRWKPDAIRAPQGETVTWRFDTPQQGGEATAAHNLFVVRPGGDRQTDSVPVGPLVDPRRRSAGHLRVRPAGPLDVLLLDPRRHGRNGGGRGTAPGHRRAGHHGHGHR